jgi:hypothetical protein
VTYAFLAGLCAAVGAWGGVAAAIAWGIWRRCGGMMTLLCAPRAETGRTAAGRRVREGRFDADGDGRPGVKMAPALPMAAAPGSFHRAGNVRPPCQPSKVPVRAWRHPHVACAAADACSPLAGCVASGEGSADRGGRPRRPRGGRRSWRSRHVVFSVRRWPRRAASAGVRWGPRRRRQCHNPDPGPW